MGFDALILVNIVLSVLGGLLAAAALIIAKKPDAKLYIDRLAAYQAFIGVGLIVVTVINFARMLRGISLIVRVMPVFGASFLVMVCGGFLLGALFGMPQIAKWIPGESPAEQKAVELSKKVAPYQVVLGIATVLASLVVLLYMIFK